jgi:glycine oxidase
VSAAWFADDGQVEPQRVLDALQVAVRRAGVVIEEECSVHSVESASGRAVGVRTARGLREADAVVLASGSWARAMEGVPDPLPDVFPVRGQMVELRLPQVAEAFGPAVVGERAYMVARDDGRVVCGTTLERVGHARGTTASGVRDILSGVIELVPLLGEADVTGVWSGFRPGCASELPVVGPSMVPGLFFAFGHYRNGILLAPHTAQVIARALLGDTETGAA